MDDVAKTHTILTLIALFGILCVIILVWPLFMPDCINVDWADAYLNLTDGTNVVCEHYAYSHGFIECGRPKVLSIMPFSSELPNATYAPGTYLVSRVKHDYRCVK